MLSFLMSRARQPIPALRPLRETSVHSASAFTPARSGRYPLSCSFNFKSSTINHSSLSFLMPIDAKLTRVKDKSFVCHSCKKHPGWGMPILAFLLHDFLRPTHKRPQLESLHGFTPLFSVYRGVGVPRAQARTAPRAFGILLAGNRCRSRRTLDLRQRQLPASRHHVSPARIPHKRRYAFVDQNAPKLLNSLRRRLPVRQLARIPRNQIHLDALQRRQQPHHAARILRRIIHLAQHHVLKRQMLPWPQWILLASL